LLPLVYLKQHLQLEEERNLLQSGNRHSEEADSAIHIVVLQADDRQFGLVVDAIHDTEEIVVKPLQKQIKSISVFAGATIMGDGKVALILDVLGLAQKANVVTGVRERALAEKSTTATEPAVDRQTVLLFATHEGGRMAIPLSLVDRLEEFPRSALERVGPFEVVQYREEILPLVPVSRVLPQRQRPSKDGRPGARRRNSRPSGGKESDPVQVVVYRGKGQRVGLIVDRILDIAEENLASRSPAQRPGILFTAVVQGRVTEFLDLEGILNSSETDFFEEPESPSPYPLPRGERGESNSPLPRGERVG
jgi:two-component system chemotaxis sensor kinase CheA